MFSGINRFSDEISKKSPDGFAERMKALKRVFPTADKIADSALSKYRRKEVGKGDVLDALAAAVTAKMGQRYGFQYVPCEPEKDSEGLSIQMVFCIPELDARIGPERE